MQCLAVDFDGVIAETSGSKRAWINDHLGVAIVGGSVSRSSLAPLIGEDAYRRMQREIGFEDTLAACPVAGACAAVQALATRYKIVIVTARPPAKLVWVRQWLDSNALNCFVDSAFSSYGRAKLAICAELECSYLIDDDLRHMFSGSPPRFVLFGECAERGVLQGVSRLEAWSSLATHEMWAVQ